MNFVKYCDNYFNIIRSNIFIHGRKLENTWTLLTKNAQVGDNELHVKDDISDWRVGDEIGIATTRRGDSTRHFITGILQ